jgi:hypothetical protein
MARQRAEQNDCAVDVPRGGTGISGNSSKRPREELNALADPGAFRYVSTLV